MQVSTKGQVTIPQDIRNRLGLLPHTEVEFELAADHARIRKAKRQTRAKTRGQMAVDLLWGSGDVHMSTDAIMELTRGEPAKTKRRK
jgi:AbrB family looped-hinge helix DNA binding protein